MDHRKSILQLQLLRDSDKGLCFALNELVRFYLISKCEGLRYYKKRYWYFFSMSGFLNSSYIKGVYIKKDLRFIKGKEYLIFIEKSYIKEDHIVGTAKFAKDIHHLKRDFL